MKSIVVVGAQWGDEGKGKVVDYMAASFDYIARCAGGHNAGHTVIYNGNRFVLQLIPCGILRPSKNAVIGMPGEPQFGAPSDTEFTIGALLVSVLCAEPVRYGTNCPTCSRAS